MKIHTHTRGLDCASGFVSGWVRNLAGLKLFALLLGMTMLAGVGGCSGSSNFVPTGNPLLDLRNPELLERDRVSAAIEAWDEVERGVRVRERTRQALKNLAWSNATTPTLRLTVLDLLMSDGSEEGGADSRVMARLLLPTERSPEAVRIIANRAVEGGWTELAPALVRSYARMSPNVPDSERDERRALLALIPGKPIERIVFDVFLNPSQGQEDTREQAVLRIAQRTRDDAWGLLARLDPDGKLRRAFIAQGVGQAEESSRVMIGNLLAAQRDFGVMPSTAMEIGWLANLREHPESRNRRLNAKWWGETSAAVASLDDARRDGLSLMHLEALRWSSLHRPAWIELSREGLFGVLSERMSKRTHHKRKSQKGELPRRERLGDWVDELSWADLLTVLVVDHAVMNPEVVEGVFLQRALDRKDSSTEYGGVIEQDADTGFRAVLFRPRLRDRMNDQRFVASDDMFRFSDRALVHYHLHANKRDNGKYAGPSEADLINASMSGRANLVFTSLGSDELNVDLYLPSGVVVDLGQIWDRK